jgi:glycosyltransferase involved in cell wall biosynthesis
VGHPLLEGAAEVRSDGARVSRLGGVDRPVLGRRLSAFDPDVVWVHGYASSLSLRALHWARRRDVIFTGDSELLQPRGLGRLALKRLLLPALFRRVAAVVDYGERNREYYRHYGVPNAKMVHGGYPLEIARFQTARDACRRSSARPDGCGTRPDARAITVVWAGVHRAQAPLDLIEAIGRLRDDGDAVQALFVGSGPLQGQMERRVEQLGLLRLVRLCGFVNQAAMPLARARGRGGDDLGARAARPGGPRGDGGGQRRRRLRPVGCVSASGGAAGVNALVIPAGTSRRWRMRSPGSPRTRPAGGDAARVS